MSNTNDKTTAVHRSLDSLVWRIEDGCLELEREITCFGSIGWLKGEWHLFRAGGQSASGGHKTIFDLLMSLSPNDLK